MKSTDALIEITALRTISRVYGQRDNYREKIDEMIRENLHTNNVQRLIPCEIQFLI